MVNLQDRANFGENATLVGADALGEFFAALEAVHIGSRTTEVGDDAFEIGMAGEPLCFRQDGGRTAPADGGAFVDGDGAEVAFTITAAMGGNGKADGIQGSDLSLGFVIGVLQALKAEGIDCIQLRLGLVRCWWILDQVPVGVFLMESPGIDGIVVAVEEVEHFDEGVLVGGDCFKGREFDTIQQEVPWLYSINRGWNEGLIRLAGQWQIPEQDSLPCHRGCNPPWHQREWSGEWHHPKSRNAPRDAGWLRCHPGRWGTWGLRGGVSL